MPVGSKSSGRGPSLVDRLLLDHLHAPELGVAAQRAAHDRQQLLRGERLHEIVLDAEAVAAFEAGRVAESREEDHRHGHEPRVVAQALEQAIAVDLRHHDVGHHQVGHEGLHDLERAHPRVRRRHLIALALENARGQQPHLIGIVNDQNMGTHACSSPASVSALAAVSLRGSPRVGATIDMRPRTSTP